MSPKGVPQGHLLGPFINCFIMFLSQAILIFWLDEFSDVSQRLIVLILPPKLFSVLPVRRMYCVKLYESEIIIMSLAKNREGL